AESGRTRSTRTLTRFDRRNCPPTTTVRNSATRQVRQRRTAYRAVATETRTTTIVLPAQVIAPNTRSERSVAWVAAHRVTATSTFTIPPLRRIIVTTTPKATAATSTANRASVKARPVTVSGSTRARRNPRTFACSARLEP